jgi:predicted nucleotidyltransferase
VEAAEYPVILRAVVGSQAQGLARPDSDFDYREVFVVPTRQLLQVPIASRPKTAWQSQSKFTDDEGGHEVGHFLDLALRCVPTVLEVFVAPIAEADEAGRELRALLPHVVSRGLVLQSFLGYADNSRAKIFKQSGDGRAPKWAITYLRALMMGEALLERGTFTLDTSGHPLHTFLLGVRDGRESLGRVIEVGLDYESRVARAARESALPERPNLAAINEWLAELRRERW